MRTETNRFSAATHNTQVSIEGGEIHADIYLKYERPVAIVLWMGADPHPYAAFKDSDDGRLQKFTLLSNDDVPRHERRDTRVNVQVEMFMAGTDVRGMALYEQGKDSPFLTVVGSAEPLPHQSFNVRRNGIFCHDFRDRDGLPVGDTFGSIFRAALHGRQSRDWSNEQIAGLVAGYSSDQMAYVMRAVSAKSNDDAWREAHQERGIAASGELERILQGHAAQQQPDSGEPQPLVKVQVENNTFSFYVTEAADQKSVRVQEFTNFQGTILESDFPLGSSSEWSSPVPAGMSDLDAVDMIGQGLLKDWDTCPKQYAEHVFVVRTFEGVGVGDRDAGFPSLDAAIENFWDVPDTKIPRVRVGGKTLVEYDPDNGMDLTFRDDAAKAAFASFLEVRVPPYHPDDMVAAVAYANETKAHFARGEHDEAFAMYRRDPNGGGQPAFRNTTKEQFVLGMYSGRDVQGNPLYPQPEGYQHAGVTVGHEALLKDSDAWGKVEHIFDFDGKPHALVASEQGKQLVAVAEIGQMRPASEQVVEQAPGHPNEDQRAALAEFRDANGRDWKSKLHTLWSNGNYSRHGIDANQAALLQQVRNEFGPEWLVKVKRAELEAPKSTDDLDMGM